MEHGCLLIQRSKVRSTGNISAYCTVKVLQIQSNTIFCNCCTKNGDITGSCSCCLKRCGSVCEDQILVIGDKTVDDSRTGIGITLSILLIKGNCIFTQFFYNFILKSLSCCIQCFMLYKLTDTNCIFVPICSTGCNCTGSHCHNSSKRNC